MASSSTGSTAAAPTPAAASSSTSAAVSKDEVALINAKLKAAKQKDAETARAKAGTSRQHQRENAPAVPDVSDAPKKQQASETDTRRESIYEQAKKSMAARVAAATSMMNAPAPAAATYGTGRTPTAAPAASSTAPSAAAKQSSKGEPSKPSLGPQPASFLRFILLTKGGGQETLEALSACGTKGVARTAAQPYSGIRGMYSWEELSGGNLCIELPAGSERPCRLLVELWGQPNHAHANRLLVPKLGLEDKKTPWLKTFSAQDGDDPLLSADPTGSSPPAAPLATGVVTLEPKDDGSAGFFSGTAAAAAEKAKGDGDAAGAIEVQLRGVGKAYNLRFDFEISIW